MSRATVLLMFTCFHIHVPVQINNENNYGTAFKSSEIPCRSVHPMINVVVFSIQQNELTRRKSHKAYTDSITLTPPPPCRRHHHDNLPQLEAWQAKNVHIFEAKMAIFAAK